PSPARYTLSLHDALPIFAERNAEGSCHKPRCLAGLQGEESLQQPRFAADGKLYCLSDLNGWWQPWREEGDGLVPVDDSAECDHAPAPWQVGTVRDRKSVAQGARG